MLLKPRTTTVFITVNAEVSPMAHENDEHIIEAIGRSRIVIRNGRVVEVGEAQITDCPLAKRFASPIPFNNKRCHQDEH